MLKPIGEQQPAAQAPAGRPLSLYVHIPFCASLCYYCACTKVITRRPERGTTYLRRLEAEIAMHGALFDSGRALRQLHLGGGTPTFLADADLEALMDTITSHFTLAPAGEREFDICFAHHFRRELAALEPMEADGLLQREARRIRILPRGRFFLRNIAMAFDRPPPARHDRRPRLGTAPGQGGALERGPR